VAVPKIERLQYGITREWHQGDVNYCILRTPEVLDRTAIEHWLLVLAVTVKLFKPDESPRIIYDLSLRGRVIPLYINAIHETLGSQNLAGRGAYQAFVLPDELLHRVLVSMRGSRQQNAPLADLVDERLFSSEADAVAWLISTGRT
jgi:hypothetical protein